MPAGFKELPDGTKLVVFFTDQLPEFLGEIVNFQTILHSDIPTYSVVADNVSPALNKNILSVFNNLSAPPSPAAKRIRVQEVYVYPRTAANNTITLQLGYINAIPTGGTDLSVINHAADFVNPPAPPNTVLAQTGNTAPNPLADLIFGGITFNLNTPGRYPIFEKKWNMSSLQLRPTLDGLTLRQVNGGATGTITAHFILTVD